MREQPSITAGWHCRCSTVSLLFVKAPLGLDRPSELRSCLGSSPDRRMPTIRHRLQIASHRCLTSHSVRVRALLCTGTDESSAVLRFSLFFLRENARRRPTTLLPPTVTLCALAHNYLSSSRREQVQNDAPVRITGAILRHQITFERCTRALHRSDPPSSNHAYRCSRAPW